MSILFISDLHLSPEKPELIALAVDFLQNDTQDITELYILGDLFNTWLGDDVISDEFSAFIDQLRQLRQRGVNTYLMVGNRDFMLGKNFAQRCGCHLLTDPSVIELYGQKVLLMHGDSLCTDDLAYQRYRRWTRNKVLQWLFLRLPKQFRQHISNKIKRKSREQKQFKSAMIMDVNPAEVDNVVQQYNAKLLIHGHTHRPAIHHLTFDSNDAYRVVLGDWHDKISYLKCDEQKFELIDHRIDDSMSVLKLS